MKKIITFSGTYFEIGKKKGQIYRQNGMKPDSIKINDLLFKKQLSVYKKYYPELLEELRGTAKYGNFSEKEIIYKEIAGEILWFTGFMGMKKACTIFGVKNKNGVFVGRNYDWYPKTQKIFEVYRTKPNGKNSYLAFSDMNYEPGMDKRNLIFTLEDIINDKGLFAGITFAHNEKWSYGLSFKHFLRIIAETCTTVDDALKLFKKLPLCCPKNFFLADRFGDMVVVEHSSKGFKIVRPKRGILIKTNHYLDSKLVKEDTVLKKFPQHNTFIRYNEALQKIREREKMFKQSDVIGILGNKNLQLCQNNSNIKTIWTLSLDMKKRNYKVYYNLFGKRKMQKLRV